MTHEPIDGRLVCGVKVDEHRWRIECPHNRDPDVHAHRCCLHAAEMRIAYADPPYIGQAKKHYRKHPDYQGEVDHIELVDRLVSEFPDGWALSLSCKSLKHILSLCPDDVRVMAWVKPMTPILPGIRVQYGWEPVIVRGGRQGAHVTGDPMTRDWLSASPVGGTFRPLGANHVIGRKPPEFCSWLFSVMGMRRGDELVDLFPGTGAVGKAWQEWQDGWLAA